MIWKMRILGLTCGIGLGFSFIAASSSVDAEPHAWLWMTERVVLPGVFVLIAVIGWFTRSAYASLSEQIKGVKHELDEVKANYVRREDSKEALKTIDSRMSRIEDKLDKLLTK